MAQSDPKKSPAVRVSLEFDKFSSFVEDYSGYLSLQGIFLKTDHLEPVGSPVAFDLRLSDGFQLLRGTGVVTWIRLADPETGRAAGMALRFHALDDKGRELVLRILEEQVKEGGAPFEPDQAPPGAIVDPELSQRTLGGPGAAPEPGTDDVTDFSPPWGGALPEIPSEMLDPEDPTVLLPTARAAAVPAATEPSPSDPSPSGPSPPNAEADGPPPLEDAGELDEEDGWEAQTSLFDEVSGLGALEGALEAEPSPQQADEREDELEALDFDVLPAVDEVEPPPEPPAEPAAGASAAPPPPAATPPEPPPVEPPLVEPPLTKPSPEPASDLPQAVSPGEQALRDPAFREAAGDDPFAGVPIEEPASRSFLDDEPPAAGVGATQTAGALHGDGETHREDAAEGDDEDWHASQPWYQEPDGGESWHRRWRPQLAAVVLLIAVLGLGYAFRDPLMQLLGLGQPPPARASAPPPAAQADVSPPDEVAEETAAGAAVDGEPITAEGKTPAASPPQPLPPPSLPPPSLPPPASASPASPPASRAPSGPPAAAEPATRVTDISWRPAEGGTRVVVELDGELDGGRLTHSRLEYSAEKKVLVVLRGIVEPYVRNRIDAGTAQLSRIRVGHHLKPGGPELHVVLDLASPAARLSDVSLSGRRLELELR